MRILGIDPGTGILGFGVIDADKGKAKLVDSGVIQYMLQKDEIVYGGFSAGSCSAGLTLRGIDLVDDKDSIPAGYPSEIIWDGLGVVPFVFVPHFRSDHPESEAMQKVVKFLSEKNIPYKTLRGGEAMIIDGEQTKVLK